MVSCVRGAQGVVCIRQEGGVWFALGRREGCGLH